MNRGLSAFLIICFFWISVSQSEAKVYKWKDENGTSHFTDDVTKVPKEFRTPSRQVVPDKTVRQPDKLNSRIHLDRDKKSPRTFQHLDEDESFQQMGDALADGLEKGMEKLGEELGKAFGGIGELMIIAQENQPDPEKKTFKNQADEIKHDTQQILLGMFLMCQFQFIIGKSETCSKEALNEKLAEGWKVDEDSEMKEKFESYDIDIDPKKNTRQNLLIKAQHKRSGNTWEITHEGKKSLKESSTQLRNADS